MIPNWWSAHRDYMAGKLSYRAYNFIRARGFTVNSVVKMGGGIGQKTIKEIQNWQKRNRGK